MKLTNRVIVSKDETTLNTPLPCHGPFQAARHLQHTVAMARLQEERAETDYVIGSQTGETRASDLGRSLQAFLTNLILLLGIGQFSRGEWSPALIALAIYVVTLVGVFCNNADR